MDDDEGRDLTGGASDGEARKLESGHGMHGKQRKGKKMERLLSRRSIEESDEEEVTLV
jgi:hypothetical protein